MYGDSLKVKQMREPSHWVDIHLEELDRMGVTLNRETDQWELAASRFGE